MNLSDNEEIKVQTKIELLDSIMGSGKTQGVIQWMLNNPQNKYLYVSPMLTEVEERIPTACQALEFTYPCTEEYKTKGQHLLKLLEEGCNVSFTHSLFTDLTKQHLALIRKHEYVLIVDEEVAFIEPYKGNYSRDDIVSLEKAGHIRVEEDNLGRVVWQWYDDNEMNDTAYSKLKRMSDLGMLYCAKRDRKIMVVHLPIELVQSSRRVILLTYLFKGSVMESFMDLKGIEIVPFAEVRPLKSTTDVLSKAKSLITFIDTTTTKTVSNLSMSSTWYSKNATTADLEKVSNAIFSVYRKFGDKESFIFTAPKSLADYQYVKDEKLKRNIIHKKMPKDVDWIYCGTKATNMWSHKSIAVHAYNRFVNTAIKAYLQDYGTPPDDDMFALSEMVQWIFRTCIRNDEPLQLCILNNRMKGLLCNWLNGN
jgi:hypothetical protein